MNVALMDIIHAHMAMHPVADVFLGKQAEKDMEGQALLALSMKIMSLWRGLLSMEL
jgi:hypothetical protein